MLNKNTAFIFARGGSKGLKNKNICKFNNEPLIVTSIKCALSSSKINRVIVSTDSSKIASIAKSVGAEVPFKRPKELSRDDSPYWDAWRHAINWAKNNGGIETFITLPCTSPLRNKKDINFCIDTFCKKKPDILITVYEADKTPDFNMVRKKNDQFELVTKSKHYQRQDSSKIYNMTTVAYIAKPDFILNKNSIFSGKVSAVKIPKGRAVDIDDIYDLEIAKMYYKKKLTKGDPEIL